jgi:hypothetical protein
VSDLQLIENYNQGVEAGLFFWDFMFEVLVASAFISCAGLVYRKIRNDHSMSVVWFASALAGFFAVCSAQVMADLLIFQHYYFLISPFSPAVSNDSRYDWVPTVPLWGVVAFLMICIGVAKEELTMERRLDE